MSVVTPTLSLEVEPSFFPRRANRSVVSRVHPRVQLRQEKRRELLNLLSKAETAFSTDLKAIYKDNPQQFRTDLSDALKFRVVSAETVRGIANEREPLFTRNLVRNIHSWAVDYRCNPNVKISKAGLRGIPGESKVNL